MRLGKEKVDPPLSSNKEGDNDGDWEMIEDNFSNSEDDFDVLCNVVSMFPIEYDVVTEVTYAEEEFSTEEMADHRLVCYYVINNGCIEGQNIVFKNPDLGMKSHLKPLFIKAKVDTYGVNKVLSTVVQQSI